MRQTMIAVAVLAAMGGGAAAQRMPPGGTWPTVVPTGPSQCTRNHRDFAQPPCDREALQQRYYALAQLVTQIPACGLRTRAWADDLRDGIEIMAGDDPPGLADRRLSQEEIDALRRAIRANIEHGAILMLRDGARDTCAAARIALPHADILARAFRADGIQLRWCLDHAMRDRGCARWQYDPNRPARQ